MLEVRARRLARRAGVARLLAGAGVGALGLAALLLALVAGLVVADRLGVSPAAPGRVRHLSVVLAALLPAEALLVGAVLARLAPRGPFQAALDADRRLGLADRFASALSLAGFRDDPMVEALLADAAHATRDLDPARLHPFPSPFRIAAAAALVAVALFLSRLSSAAPPAPQPGEDLVAEGRRAGLGEGEWPTTGTEGRPGDESGPGESEDPGQAEGGGESSGGEGEGGAGGASPGPEDPAGVGENGADNPGERPGDQLFADPERAPAPREKIDLPSLFSPGRPVTREAMVRETTPGEGGVPGPGKTVLTPELYQEFRRVAESEIRSPRRTQEDRDLVRRYFERIAPAR